MELSPNIDKYLSFADKQALQTINQEIASDYDKLEIAKSNRAICQGIISQYEGGATSWPDNATAIFVPGTTTILGYSHSGQWYGKGEHRLSIFTHRDAFDKIAKDLQNKIDGLNAERNALITTYNAKYKNALEKDRDAARGVAVTYATKMNEMNISAYKYALIGGILILSLVVYKKFKK
jgi:hypothetical protein